MTTVKPLKSVPEGITPIASVQGTAAYDYINGGKSITTINDDHRFLGGLIQHDGVLLIFQDGSSIMNVTSTGIN